MIKICGFLAGRTIPRSLLPTSAARLHLALELGLQASSAASEAPRPVKMVSLTDVDVENCLCISFLNVK